MGTPYVDEAKAKKHAAHLSEKEGRANAFNLALIDALVLWDQVVP